MRSSVSQLSASFVGLHRKVRTIRTRSIALAAFILSIGLVTVHLPLRWQGGRTAQDADIPLRPLTPLEAAALLTGGPDGRRLAAVVRLTKSDVTVRTGVYLIPS